jgi:hypothetical protein
LKRIQALLKPTKEHGTNPVSLVIWNRRSEVPAVLVWVSSIGVRPQGVKAFGHVDVVFRGGLDKMGLHLGMNQIDQ